MAKHKQADHRAETRGQGLSGLPHVVADSPAYLDLTPFERAVHAEILKRFNGYNNGSIGITFEEIGARLKGPNAGPPNNARIARAIVALMEHGLVAEPTLQSWLQRRARTYRLTYISSGKGPPFKPATNEYCSWEPREAKNDGDAESPRKPQTGDAASPRGNSAGDAQSPTNAKNGSFASSQSTQSGDAQSSLICIPYPPDESGDDPDPVALIRTLVADWWRIAGKTDRLRLAEKIGLEIGELLGFVEGSLDLPFPKVAALQSSLSLARAA